MAYFELNNEMPLGIVDNCQKSDNIDNVSESGRSLSNYSEKCNSDSTDISRVVKDTAHDY